MVRSILAIFVVALGSSAEALPRVPIQQPDQVVIMAREHAARVCTASNGVCVTTPARSPHAGARLE
jgi:hypothetical protein